MRYVCLILYTLSVILLSSSQKCTLSFVVSLTPTNICYNISETFPKLNPIYSLSCVYCNITVIHDDVINWFRGESFNVSASNVSKICQKAFENFSPRVKKFIFDDNNIESFDDGLFERFKNLEVISFRNNKLDRLKPKQFTNISVFKLDLSHNRLTDIRGVFDGITLKVMKLSNNNIKEIHGNSFATVYPNRYKSSASPGLTKSEMNYEFEVYLDHNNISLLYPLSFQGLNETRLLDLSYNHIDQLPEAIFSPLASLTCLNLSGNKLIEISPIFSELLNLEILDVSHNFIKQISNNQIGVLTHLNLSNNFLEEVDFKELTKNNSQLKSVAIDDNFWVCKYLVYMYKTLVHLNITLSTSVSRYNVPNFHGIACSKVQLAVSDFDEFLTDITNDLEDFYDHQTGKSENNTNLDYLAGIFYITLVLTIIVVYLFLHFLFVHVYSYCKTIRLYKHLKNFASIER